MKTRLLPIVALIGIGVAHSQAQVLSNPSFESPSLSTNGWTYEPLNASWRFDPMAGIANGDSPWGRGAVQGTQYGFLQRNSELDQTITSLSLGHNYAFTFWMMRRNGSFGADNGVPLKALLDGSIVFPQTFYDLPTWKIAGSHAFTASSSSALLKFVTLPDIEDRAELIDDIKIFEVQRAPVASMVLTSGILANGTSGDISASDDVYWSLKPEPGSDQVTTPIRVAGVFGISTASPRYLSLQIESAASTGVLRQVVKLYNFQTNIFDTVGNTVLLSSDNRTHVVVVSNPTSYVDPLAMSVRCQIQVDKTSFPRSNSWRYRIDEIAFFWN